MGATYEFHVLWDKNLTQEQLVEQFGEHDQWLNPQKDFDIEQVMSFGKSVGELFETFFEPLREHRAIHGVTDILKIEKEYIPFLLERERMNFDFTSPTDLSLLEFLCAYLNRFDFTKHTLILRIC